MKTERRHELQTNELADWIGTQSETVRPYVKTLIGVALVAVVGLLMLSMSRGRTAQLTAAAWNEYFAATELPREESIQALSDVAERYAGTKAAGWALQSLGDIQSITGARDMFVNREEARERLTAAKEAYENVINASKNVKMLQQRAHMGLAQVHESLNELDMAKSEYELIVSRWPETALAKQAEKRLQLLEAPGTSEFYNWFVSQEPRQPQDPTTGNVTSPSIFDDLPKDPELSLPDASDLEKSLGLEAPESSTEPASDAGMESDPPADAAPGTDPSDLQLGEAATDAPDATDADAGRTNPAIRLKMPAKNQTAARNSI